MISSKNQQLRRSNLEAETYFLFVFWTEEPKPYKVEGSMEYRGFDITMRRTSMQRPIRPNDKFRRVPIDFDPLNKNLVYAVTCFFKNDSANPILTDITVPAYVVETREEADELKKKLESGGWKEFTQQRKDKLDKVEIHPLVVTTV
jgi:hypothetical protein